MLASLCVGVGGDQEKGRKGSENLNPNLDADLS